MKTLLLTFALIAASASAQAEVPHDSISLRARLSRQIYLVNAIEPYIERSDLPRFLSLRRIAQDTLDHLSIDGLANMLTIQRLQELVIGFRFSKDVFALADSPIVHDKLSELSKIGQEIGEITGFDKSPYTRITADVLEKIYDLTAQLLTLPVDASLNERIRSFRPVLGRGLAVARAGDRAETFRVAAEVMNQLKAFYPAFNQVASGNAAFDTVLEIQGLTEFYLTFAHADAQESKP